MAEARLGVVSGSLRCCYDDVAPGTCDGEVTHRWGHSSAGRHSGRWCGEGGAGRCGEMRGDVGRCGEVP